MKQKLTVILVPAVAFLVAQFIFEYFLQGQASLLQRLVSATVIVAVWTIVLRIKASSTKNAKGTH